MKFRILTSTAAIFLTALAAQSQPAGSAPGNYYLVNLGTPLGGTAAGPSSINNLGWIAGGALLAGNASEHATLWLGAPVDLGTLGGPNSNVAWPNKNNTFDIVGIAETAEANPLGEAWSCSGFFPTVTNQVCLGFVWHGGTMTALPTLGGYDGYAAGVSNPGQIVGWAENTVHDSTCVTPQVLQFEAVVWEPASGKTQQLPPYPGDPDSAATAINDEGEVVGISGICGTSIGEFSAAHALLWDNGKPIDIGSLGGVAWNTPTAINDLGHVVGFSDLPGDSNGTPNYNAFLWTKSSNMVNLKTLPGDAYSAAYAINNQGQIVGQSIDANGNSMAFLWQNGVMTDLNTLIPANSNLTLVYANDINNAGEIAGQACVPVNGVCSGDSPGFLLVPMGQAASSNAATGTAVLSDKVRQQLRPRTGAGMSVGLGPR